MQISLILLCVFRPANGIDRSLLVTTEHANTVLLFARLSLKSLVIVTQTCVKHSYTTKTRVV